MPELAEKPEMSPVPGDAVAPEPPAEARPSSARRRRSTPLDPRRGPAELAGSGDEQSPALPPATGGIAAGVAILRAALRNVPASPGVYRMLDRKGDALYVGKARNLKSAGAELHASRPGCRTGCAAWWPRPRAIEIVVTHTEAEALLLECNLIKRLMPRFNVLLRDDKSFPFIHLTADHEFPQLTKHRGARDKGGAYFGPVRLGRGGQPHADHAAEGVPAALVQRQRLRQPHPALPAVPDQALQRALRRPHRPRGLRGAGRAGARFPRRAQRAMCSSASPPRWRRPPRRWSSRRAALIRDRIRALSLVQGHQDIHVAGIGEADVIAAHQAGGQTCVQVFFFRGGQNWGNRAYFPSHDRQLAGRGGAGRLHRPVLRQPAEAAAGPAEPRAGRAGALAEALSLGRAARSSSPCRSAATRSKLVDACAGQRARGARPPAGRERGAAAAARRGRRGASASTRRRSASRSTTTATSRARNAVGAMIVAGPEGLRQERLPQVQHPRHGPPDARHDALDRRGDDYADDARGAAPPLRPRARRRTRSATAAPGPTWC